MTTSLIKHTAFLITLLLLNACSSQPSQTAQPQAQSLPIAQATAKATPVFVPPTLSAKPGPSGQFSRQGDQVTLQIQLPPLPAFQTQALNFAGANQITATLMNSSGHTYTPVGAIDNQVAYPLNGELSLSFTGVRPDELLIAELQVQVNAADVPQAYLAAVLGAASTANASGEISFRTTPTALVVKAMLPTNVSQARGLSLSALQTFVDSITGASGTGVGTTYSVIHPTLVNTDLLATNLATMPIASLTALDYRNAGATANITVSGLVSTDRVRLQLTDAASAVVTSAGEGLVSLSKATPGTGLKLLASSVGTPGTTYTYAPDSSSITLTEGQPTAISLVATPATPTLTNINPSSAKAGDTLTLTGSDFHRDPEGNTVTIGGIEASVESVTDKTTMTVTVPTGVATGSVNVVAKVGTASSDPQILTVLPSGTVTALSASSGKSGDSITITGTEFTGATDVRFNGRSAASITPVNDTELIVVVPYGAVSTGKVSVVTTAGTAESSGDFAISQRIWLVNASATGNNGGTNWLNAYKDLQTALNHASLASGDEIWVAKGKYTPIAPVASPSLAQRAATFQLRAGVKVYGGFAGGETALPEVRNFVTNLTELSGDIDTVADVYDTDIADEIVHGGISGNSLHVVTGVTGAILDGFTIRGGYTDYSYPIAIGASGAGIFNYGSSPTLRNLIVSGNTAYESGGGMFNFNSSPTLSDVTIRGNAAVSQDGGGIYHVTGTASLTHVIINGNSAYGRGGGVYINHTSTFILNQGSLSGNSAENGGGLYNTEGGLTLNQVNVSGNLARGDGGGLYNIGSNFTLSHVTFNANTAPSGNGGGIHHFTYSGTPVLVNVLFWNSPLFDLTLPEGKGNVVASSDPFVDSAHPDGGDGIWLTADDGLKLKANTPEVIDKGINQTQVDDLMLGITLPQLDALGNSRPQGAGYDPGAYESVPPIALPAGTGFRMNGLDDNDSLGTSVSNAGDLNHDGFDDLIIGAYGADHYAGASYVLFGSATLGSGGSPDLVALSHPAGFVIEGEGGNTYSGYSVSGAGDLNHDGYDDLIIGAVGENASYVVYGSQNLGSGGNLQISDLTGTTGFRINGTADVGSGYAVSGVGDLDADGFDDLLIGGLGSDGGAGANYVVYGSANMGAGDSLELSDLNGTTGFRINEQPGDENYYYFGYSASGAGDLNQDGHQDLIMGAYGSNAQNGSSYVLFGSPDRPTVGLMNVSTLTGTNGFKLDGISGGLFGYSVSGAGDLNHDGFDDLIIGAYTENGGAGASYVVYGAANLGTGGSIELSSLTGATGFRINGVSGDYSGYSVSGAGDFNQDGYDDLLIGAQATNGFTGSSYVVYGSANLGAGGSLALSALTGTNGFKLNGVAGQDKTGNSVSGAGDLNHDGFDDLIIGANRANDFAGSSYVLYGTSATFPASLNLGSLTSLP